MNIGNVACAQYSMNPEAAPRDTSSVAKLDVGSIVFVVDDDLSVQESLDTLIRSVGWHPEMFVSAAEFLCRPRPMVPCCLVLDVRLPLLGGLELQGQLAERGWGYIPIIFITGHGDVPTTVRAMKAGAIDFLTKPFKGDVLLDAIGVAIARSRTALRLDAELCAVRRCYGSLSPREREVMGLVVSGLLNKQIAGELGISEITVKSHRHRVMYKMNAASLADLVTMATNLHLVFPQKSRRRLAVVQREII